LKKNVHCPKTDEKKKGIGQRPHFLPTHEDEVLEQGLIYLYKKIIYSITAEVHEGQEKTITWKAQLKQGPTREQQPPKRESRPKAGRTIRRSNGDPRGRTRQEGKDNC
jgi:hypothetical protein